MHTWCEQATTLRKQNLDAQHRGFVAFKGMGLFLKNRVSVYLIST